MNLTKGKEYEIDVKADGNWYYCDIFDLDQKLSDWHVYDTGNYNNPRTFTVEPTGDYKSGKFLTDLKSAVSSTTDCDISSDSLSIENVRPVGTAENKSWLTMIGVAGVTALTVGGLMEYFRD